MTGLLPNRNLVIGYHGCEAETAKEIAADKSQMKFSKNPYDWLGNGIYFWQDDPVRALEWAFDRGCSSPAVVGAVINLGNCLDLLTRESCKLLGGVYPLFKQEMEDDNQEIPKNIGKKHYLDCAVIDFASEHYRKANIHFDTVRSLYSEGKGIFTDSNIMDKNHIHIAVRNVDMILGCFYPLKIDFATALHDLRANKAKMTAEFPNGQYSLLHYFA